MYLLASQSDRGDGRGKERDIFQQPLIPSVVGATRSKSSRSQVPGTPSSTPIWVSGVYLDCLPLASHQMHVTRSWIYSRRAGIPKGTIIMGCCYCKQNLSTMCHNADLCYIL